MSQKSAKMEGTSVENAKAEILPQLGCAAFKAQKNANYLKTEKSIYLLLIS